MSRNRNVLTAVVAHRHMLRWKQKWNKIECTSPELGIACTSAVKSSAHDLQWKLNSQRSVARNLVTVQVPSSLLSGKCEFQLPWLYYSASKSWYLCEFCEYWSTLSTSNKSSSPFVFCCYTARRSPFNQHLARQTWKTCFKDCFTGQRLYF
jgi:hypothetical protein